MADRPTREREMKLPTITSNGRVYTRYEPTLALDIVERIAEGELLRDITSRDAQPRTVTRSTFLRWVATVPDLAKAYAAAQRISALALEEEALTVAKAVKDAPGSPQRVSAANSYISQLRWSASRRDPSKYSDKGNLNIVVPVNISTNLDLGTGTGRTDVEVPDMYTIHVDTPAATEEVADAVEEGVFEEITSSEQLADVLKDVPEGTAAQPLLRKERKPMDMRELAQRPRKRVLTPRNPNYERKGQ